MRATGDSITAGRSFRKPKIRGIFRFREKPGCPFQARLFALVPAGLALRPPSRPPLADAQEGESRATQPERSHAGATTSATRETPLRRLAYPQRLARLAPGQRPEQPPLPTVPPCACRARRPWKTCLSQCAGLRAGFPQVRPVDKSGWHVKGARAAPTGWRGPQPEGRGLGPGGANP